jgi:hypothetical protein
MAKKSGKRDALLRVREVLTARQRQFLVELNSLTETNPGFRAVVLDELDKQANAGRPKVHPSSAAFAQCYVDTALLDLAHMHAAAPRRVRFPTVTAAIRLAATRLGVGEGKVRSLWYLQGKDERDEIVRIALKNTGISRKKRSAK